MKTSIASVLAVLFAGQAAYAQDSEPSPNPVEEQEVEASSQDGPAEGSGQTVQAAAATANPAAERTDEAKWDVTAPRGANIRQVPIRTDEGTWMDVDVSPDGRTLAFALLGDIYTMPITGGTPTRVAEGLAWEVQPRFSPDGRRIATAASGQLEQYERLVNQLKDSARTSREDYQQNMVTMNQMFNKALDSVKDTAMAFSSVPATVAAPPPPDLRSHTAPDGTVTLLFSDIEGSTAMFDRLGDLRAQEVLHIHNDIFRQRLASFDGHEVKSMGDGFMLAFSSARRALQCAVAIQTALAAYNEEQDNEPLRMRIGIHTGEALSESDDFYGKHVILASRVAGQAQGGQILVSSLFKALTDSAGDIVFGEEQEVELKGLSGLNSVYPVEWR